MIYLDNAATTLRKPPCVIDAVVQAMQTMGNSGRSAHAESLAAARTIFAAREALAALFGLIPNCSVSVLLTKLYLGGVIGAGPMLAGLCANGGVGLLVLFRMNGSLKKNISVTALMWALGVFWGVVARIIFAFI